MEGNIRHGKKKKKKEKKKQQQQRIRQKGLLLDHMHAHETVQLTLEIAGDRDRREREVRRGRCTVRFRREGCCCVRGRRRGVGCQLEGKRRRDKTEA